MATSIVMPQMGYDMQEGTVVRWHKKEGDPVVRGEVIADIETDKATVEFEAFTAGVLRKIVVEEGIAIPVGELIAVITDPDEPLPEGIVAVDARAAPSAASAATAPGPTAAPAPAADAQPAAPTGEIRASPIARRLARERGIDLSQVAGTGPGGRIVEQDIANLEQASAAPAAAAAPDGEVRASPIARRLARERGIDLSQISGTGPGGRIVEQDVVSYTPSAAPPAVVVPAEAAAPTGEERAELSRMRQTIAKVTADSKREAPHFYVASTVDMTKAMDVRRDINDAVAAETRVSVNDLIIKACALALSTFPKFNAFFRGDHLQMNSSVNIGIAIALEAGLIVPGISACESKSLLEIAAASSDLIARANNGTLRNEEYSGTTFSISNLGMFDVESFSAIIYPPHAAVLAVGTVKEQPVARDGQLAIAPVMTATLSVDHRVADGAEAAQFLMEVKKLLQNPLRLMLE